MNHDERALLDAVIAFPDDDMPRLVLADWYEEQGQAERGEFIRVQCEMARMGFPGPLTMSAAKVAVVNERHRHDTSERSMLGLRSCQLLYQFGRSWGDVYGRTAWSRGFIDEVRCGAGEWVGNGHRLLVVVNSHPVRKVVFANKTPLPTISGDQWSWNSFTQIDDTLLLSNLIDYIFDRLSGYTYIAGGHPAGAIKFYPSKQAALDALSDAAIAWAKAQAG